MSIPGVSIVSILQGAAVVGGNALDTIEMAAIAVSHIDPKNIIKEDRVFYDALSYSVTKKVPLDGDVFRVFLDSQPIEDKDKLLAMRRFAEATQTKADRAKFLSLLAAVDYKLRKQKLLDRMFAASLALEKEYYDEDSKIHYSGLEGAQDLLGQAISDSSIVAADRFPSGNVLNEKDVILKEYLFSADPNNSNTVKSGYDAIDSVTGGHVPGELVLVGAFTGEGKSMLVANMAWSAAIEQAKNVVVITAETLRAQYRRRVLSRHSNHPKFGLPEGIPSKAIKSGALSPDMHDKFLEVVEDFTGNPNYGYLNILQVTSGATLREVRRELEAINANIPLDVVFIDYLSLLSPSRHRGKKQEETVEVIREAKELAITFNGGQGIVCVSAHQMSSNAREFVKPIAGKFYTIRDFADTSEAGKSADIAIALLRDDDLQAMNEVCVGFLKCRDSELGPLFRLTERYSSSYLGSQISVGGVII